jgi:RNA polymerase sigma-70 factor (ECF subfamily)
VQKVGDKPIKGSYGILISEHLSDNGVSFISPRIKMTSTIPPSDVSSANSELSVDQKLVVRVQKGDKAAFDMLVVKYQSRVASVVSRYVSDFHEVADVTQEAFIKAYRAIDRFRGDSAFYTWIYRIAINCAKNYLQSKGRRPPSSDIAVDDAEHITSASALKDIASPEQLLNKEQLESVIKRSIKNLPEDLRIALTLREFDNLSYDDIAVVMDCPVGTVRSRIFRAREAIDKEISSMGGV